MQATLQNKWMSSLAAMLIGTASANHVVAAADVDAVSYTPVAGTPSSSTVQGSGVTKFKANKTYNIHWSGLIHQVDAIDVGTDTYLPTLVADTVKVRHFITADPKQNNAINWFTGVGETTDTDLYLEGEQPTDYEGTFAKNNLLVGIDNLFVNIPEGANNHSNVERLDYIFSAGIEVTETLAFTIFERGDSDIHDGFKIASIKTVDGSNDPSDYGTLLNFGMGDWGKTDIVAPTNSIVLRDNLNTAAVDYRPSQNVLQGIGAVLIKATDLAPLGSIIYGYSLFGPDVTGAGTQLVDFLNQTHFARNTNGINGSVVGGGLDLIGASSVLYDSRTPANPNVPEPASLSLLMVGGLLVARRNRR